MCLLRICALIVQDCILSCKLQYIFNFMAVSRSWARNLRCGKEGTRNQTSTSPLFIRFRSHPPGSRVPALLQMLWGVGGRVIQFSLTNSSGLGICFLSYMMFISPIRACLQGDQRTEFSVRRRSMNFLVADVHLPALAENHLYLFKCSQHFAGQI